jgi:hypothetical protein
MTPPSEIGSTLVKQKNLRAFFLALLLLFLVFAFYVFWSQRQQTSLEIEELLQTLTSQKALAFHKEADQTRDQQFLYFLKALETVEKILKLDPQHFSALQEKLRISFAAIEILALEENKSLEELFWRYSAQTPSFSQGALQKQLEQLKEKRRTQVHTQWNRLKHLLRRMSLSPEVYEQSLYELSQLREKTVFEEIVQELHLGKKYFLQHPAPAGHLSAYYNTLAQALGKMENPRGGKYLLTILREMTEALSFLEEKNRGSASIQYMISLAKGLRETQTPHILFQLSRLSLKMGGRFSQEIEPLLEDLAQQEALCPQKKVSLLQLKDQEVLLEGGSLQGLTPHSLFLRSPPFTDLHSGSFTPYPLPFTDFKCGTSFHKSGNLYDTRRVFAGSFSFTF